MKTSRLILGQKIAKAGGVAAGQFAGVFTCPSDSIGRGGGSNAEIRTYAFAYGFNRDNVSGTARVARRYDASDSIAGGTQYDNNTVIGYPLSVIQAPATTIMVVEHPSRWNEFAHVNNGIVNKPSCTAAGGGTDWMPCQDDAVAPMHFDGWNYLFSDGHVKFLKPAQITGGRPLNDPRGMWTLDPND
jgi:prepilin-type processing-associated H-X9-DG protein